MFDELLGGIALDSNSDFMAEDGWITIHPNGKGKNADYARIYVDDDGIIQTGAGGKFNGKSLKQAFSKEANSESPYSYHDLRSFKDAIDAFTRTAGAKERADAIKVENKDFERLVTDLGLNWDLYGMVGTARKKFALVMDVPQDKLNAAIEKLQKKNAAKSKAAIKAATTRKAKQEAARTAAASAQIPNSHGRPLDAEDNIQPLQIKSKTEKAYKVVMPSGYEKWLPKSQCTESGGYIAGIAEWFAKKEGISVSQSEDHKKNLQNYLQRKEDERRKERKHVQNTNSTDIASRRADEDAAAKDEGLVRMVIPEAWLNFYYMDTPQTLNGRKYKIVRPAKNWSGFTISDDDPSLHGSHLLGYEGSVGRYVYVRQVD